ncbi:MAG TPA: DUF3616 domain-containing protein [Devosia sp.]|uniref:DUF3616 domain-containing protein n=1 Tax=Devosia sp. TaxID=1871048 RepID=UPI002F940D22
MAGKTIKLEFSPVGDGARLGRDISALAIAGRTLFCASDETASIEQLVLDPLSGTFAAHRSILLTDYFTLPAGGDEIDIEGMAVHQGRLWITGSHSLKRRKLGTGDSSSKLGRLKWDPNRSFIGYLPLSEEKDGIVSPVPSSQTTITSRPRMMKVGAEGQKGLRWLFSDCVLFQPFMNVPAKENGFDVEGLAVVGDRVVLGLRGPVLGRHAFLVSLQFKETGEHFLKPKRLDGSKYRLHALDIGGFGIRDLLVVGDELLILAGPTQAIEGLAKIYAVRGLSPADDVIPKERLRHIATLPMRDECDHAEGLAHLTDDGAEYLVVAHDNPAPERLNERAHTLLLDLIPWQRSR